MDTPTLRQGKSEGVQRNDFEKWVGLVPLVPNGYDAQNKCKPHHGTSLKSEDNLRWES